MGTWIMTLLRLLFGFFSLGRFLRLFGGRRLFLHRAGPGGDGFANKKNAAVWSWQRSFNQKKIFFGVDGNQGVISRRHLVHAHVAGHAHARLGLATLAAPGRAGRDGAGAAVFALGAVRGGLTAEVVALG